MRLPLWAIFFSLIGGYAPAFAAADEERPYGIERRVPWTTSQFSGTPDPPLPYVTERVLPQLTFENPVDLMAIPGTERLLVVELGGKLWSIPAESPAPRKELVADLRQLPDAQEAGNGFRVYGFAFHPQFEQNRNCFICYVHKSGDPAGTRVSRLRATSLAPLRLDVADEDIVITWLSGGHNGGSLQFGPEDGMLYISTGDGSPPFPPDTHRTGQDVSDLLASILRIDVDHPEQGRPYSIPKDNPFVGLDGARGEVWTLGHRNPWRMSFDDATGDLWIGDVGWEMWEMIYRAAPGANFGWSILEHTQQVLPEVSRGPTPITPPAAAHSHTESRSITGGYVYRGTRLPELAGLYIYGDYVTGKIWGLDVNSPETPPRELADSTLQVICFGVDQKRELYVVGYDGSLHRLVPNPRAGQSSNFPRSLGASGLFSDVAEHELAPGVIPYDVIVEPWADGTTAKRFVALPGVAQLGVHEASNLQKGDVKGEWSYPDGAVLGKTILLETSPGKHVRLETQILHRNGDQWEAYSYIWNASQNDAMLSDGGGFEQSFEVRDPAAPDGVRQQTWRFAARSECIICHTTRGGSIYGFRPEQLNRHFNYDGVTDNQLRTLAHIQFFTEPVDDSAKAVDPADASASLDQRARSYLNVNCATCHRRGGGGTASIELLTSLPWEQTRLISRPTQGTFGFVDPWIVAPGDPYRSVLYYRMMKLGRGRMPHFGSEIVDPTGIRLIYDWISQLPASSGEHTAEKSNQELDQLQHAIAAAVDDLGGGEEAQQSAVDRLLSSTRGAVRLATLLRSEQFAISQTLRAAAISRGAAAADPTIRDVFEPFLPESERVKRLGTDVDASAILLLTGSAERGRQLFLESKVMQCRNCHRLGTAGKSVGPDLADIGKRLSRREIFDNILDPSRKIDPKYRTWLVQTIDGKVVSGLLMERNEQTVVVRDSAGNDTRIGSDEIELIVAQQKSLMPDLLLRDATPQDAADLLAFLAELKGN